MQEQLLADLQGRKPLLGIHTLAALVHPWTSEVPIMQATHKHVGKYAYMEVGGRASPGAGSREQRRSSCRSDYRST